MSYTNKTPNYDLPQYVADDKPTYLGDFNKAMLDIDTAIKNASDTATASQTLAQNANNISSEALNTAQTASTDVASANTKADNAFTLATNAQTQAESAETLASDAKTIANTANQTATSAQTTANTASSTASTANTTAQAAQSVAQSVATDLENYMTITAVDPSEIIQLATGYSFFASHLHKQANHYFGYVDVQCPASVSPDGTTIGTLIPSISSPINAGIVVGSQYNAGGVGNLYINQNNKNITVYGSGSYIKFYLDLVVNVD